YSVSVSNGCVSYNEIKYFAFVINHKVKVKPMYASHRGSSSSSNSFKNFVVTYTLIMANSYWCGVYTGYSCALTQATSFHEKNKWQKISLHQFYKSIVRDRSWEFLFHVFLDIENVEVFEVLKTT